jgi:hypothetical protein
VANLDTLQTPARTETVGEDAEGADGAELVLAGAERGRGAERAAGRNPETMTMSDELYLFICSGSDPIG